ncbi:TetR/AcrR family transcriptional regulator [Planctomonas sp. JC2975]|uniref:TetR/AcrR family transcriptional regulator n=1 Tax=Planctomonas sp. JC2975 TaxID=2729626 RepID=UPI0014760733|nr:TetR/AcrR family transcriptional regulator [Planctomonas sp. JC2975]NNC11976.1 TetR/AcrR family transcriptional regulator [Planctomonas sp. JC2975]
MRARKSAEILAAARELFLRDGFAATSIDAIAGAAGVSKATVYSNFTDKDALLIALLEAITEELSAVFARTAKGLEGDGTPRERFIGLGTSIVNGVLRPEVLSLRRLAVAQASAFPRQVAEFWRNGPASTVELIAAHLERMAKAGELDVAEPHEASAQLTYSLTGPFQDRALLAGELPSQREIAAHVSATVDAFLRAYAA